MKQIGQILKELGWDAKLRDLARRVENNVPRHGDPQSFHEEKSEIANRLKELAKGDVL